MVVTLDSLDANMDTTSSRLVALRAVERLGHRAGDRAKNIVSRCLKDDNRTVRHGAFNVMTQVAQKGDTESIAEVAKCLEHRDPETRSRARVLLWNLAER